LASGISCLISILQGVEFPTFVFRFAITAFLFYIFGVIIRVVIDRAFKIDKEETEKQKQEEFDVTTDGEEDDNQNQNGDGISLDDEMKDESETKE
jgi:hypothetical protein